MTLLPKFALEAKKLREAATPGPWKTDKDHDVITKKSENGMHRMVCGSYSLYPTENDAAFIAASPKNQELLERALELAIQALSRLEKHAFDQLNSGDPCELYEIIMARIAWANIHALEGEE